MFNEELKKKIVDRIKKTSFSGVAGIYINKQCFLEQASGYLDIPNKISNNINTKFGIASGTKFFTALGILRLIEDGKLKLSDKVFEIISYNYPTYDKSINIEHLLTHSSGLPDYYDEDLVEDFTTYSFTDKPYYELLKPTDYLHCMPNSKMKFEPGTKFNYNNSGYVFLAMIIEIITGDYHLWIKKEVLEKACMNDSGFFLLNKLPANTATGYVSTNNNGLCETNVYALPIIGGGDGGMFTTLHDMNSFWYSLFDGKIISNELLNEVLKPHMKDDNIYYGYGVWLVKKDNDYIPFIEGGDVGVTFKSFYDYRKSLLYTIISNADEGLYQIEDIFIENE